MLCADYARLIAARSTAIQSASDLTPEALEQFNDALADLNKQIAAVRAELLTSKDIVDRAYVLHVINGLTVTKTAARLSIAEATAYRYLRAANS